MRKGTPLSSHSLNRQPGEYSYRSSTRSFSTRLVEIVQ